MDEEEERVEENDQSSTYGTDRHENGKDSR
jgi:hypothetical protein